MCVCVWDFFFLPKTVGCVTGEHAILQQSAFSMLHRWEADHDTTVNLKRCLGDIERLSLIAHYNRCGLLWLVSRFASGNILDVAGLLVVLEQSSFWTNSLWRSSFDACMQLSFSTQQVVNEENDDDLSSSSSNSGNAKKGNKKKGKKKKLRRGRFVLQSIPATEVSEGRIFRRMCFFVRPWLEYAAKCALLGSAGLSASGKEENSTRIHFDSKVGSWIVCVWVL